MDQISRKSPHVAELVEAMDRRLEEANNDPAKVFAALSPADYAVIEEEIRRCQGNDHKSVRYYLENYHVINAAAKTESFDAAPNLTTLQFNEPQEWLWEDFVFCRTNKLPLWWILLKCRQIGWSTIVQGILFHNTVFNRFITSLTLADEKPRSAWLFNMSKLAYDSLPYWMQPEMQYDVKDTHIKFDRKDAELRKTNPGLKSTLICDAANKLSGVGRGMTFHCVHASEISRYIKPNVLTLDIMPATLTNIDHPLSMFVIEGTAEGKNTFFADFWKSIKTGRYDMFRPVFAAWWKEKRYSRPFKNEEAKANFRLTEEEIELKGKVKDEYDFDLTHEQLNFRRQTQMIMEDAGKDTDLFEQEYPSYPEAAFRAPGKTFFPKKRLYALEKATVRKPIWFGDIGRTKKKIVTPGEIDTQAGLKRMVDMDESPLWIWEFPKNGNLYYIGADPGQGIQGGNWSAASIWRVPLKPDEDYIQVAEYRGLTEPTQFARVIANLGELYLNCEVCPERNKLTTVISDLLHVIKYPKIYRRRRHEKASMVTNDYGWETNEKTRQFLMDRTKSLMNLNQLQVKSKRLIDEFFTFVDSIEKPGHFEAPEGESDDCLFGAMIALACMLDIDPKLISEMTEPTVAIAKKQASDGSDFYNTDYSPIYDTEETANVPDYEYL